MTNQPTVSQVKAKLPSKNERHGDITKQLREVDKRFKESKMAELAEKEAKLEQLKREREAERRKEEEERVRKAIAAKNSLMNEIFGTGAAQETEEKQEPKEDCTAFIKNFA